MERNTPLHEDMQLQKLRDIQDTIDLIKRDGLYQEITLKDVQLAVSEEVPLTDIVEWINEATKDIACNVAFERPQDGSFHIKISPIETE